MARLLRSPADGGDDFRLGLVSTLRFFLLIDPLPLPLARFEGDTLTISMSEGRSSFSDVGEALRARLFPFPLLTAT